MACRGLWRRPVDVAAHDRRGRRSRANGPFAARQTDRSTPTRASGSACPVRSGGHLRLLLRHALYAARRRHDLLHGDAAHHYRAVRAAAWRKGRALSLDRRPGRLRWRPHCAQAFAADAILGRANRAIRSDRLCAEPDDHARSPGHPLGRRSFFGNSSAPVLSARRPFPGRGRRPVSSTSASCSLLAWWR